MVLIDLSPADMVYIETPRLLLRDWKEEDLRPFADMNKDPMVMEFFLKRLSEAETLDFCNRIADEFTQFGYGLYACLLYTSPSPRDRG